MGTKPSQEDEVVEYLVEALGYPSQCELQNIRWLIKKLMVRYDFFDTCEDMPREG